MIENCAQRMEAIVKAVTSRYRNFVNMPYEDLLQEGYLAAMKGVQRWHKSQGKAMMIAWAWIYIRSRCKELTTKSNSAPKIVPYEEHKNTETVNATDLYIDGYFTDTVEEESIDDSSPLEEEYREAFMFLKSALNSGYSDIVQRVEKSRTPKDAADQAHLTMQRINQLNKKMEELFLINA